MARLCNLKGTIKQNMEAMGKILELVMKYEMGNNQQAMGKILELVMKYEMGNNQQNSKDKDKTDENM